ncbi:DoxX family protein [Empedobacter tilapiae]|uniref:DoxX family protein n=1 Tax=Empedobacter tilapiae TaxID=2491114 RepID=A0A4Z1C1N5_9FLAO|nr:DoxX family protein [Empedobacter tilapiae]TGN26291.1 DoxX family protein [Empedobacter tilapiae]
MSTKFKLLGNQPAFIDVSLLLIRIAAGGFMFTHGFGKLQKLVNGNFEFGDPIGLGPEISLGLTVFAEILCAFLVFAGLFTRLASIPLIITMLVAVFIVHVDDDFGKKELGLFYLINYLVIFLSGAGKYSLDKLILKK